MEVSLDRCSGPFLAVMDCHELSRPSERDVLERDNSEQENTSDENADLHRINRDPLEIVGRGCFACGAQVRTS